MKGMSLPINVMVVVLLTMIVLASLIWVFFGVWDQSNSSIASDNARNSGCNKLISMNCNEDPNNIEVNYDADKDGDIDFNDNLDDLFENFYKITGTDNIKAACRCIV